jgi:hypothetical protein
LYRRSVQIGTIEREEHAVLGIRDEVLGGARNNGARALARRITTFLRTRGASRHEQAGRHYAQNTNHHCLYLPTRELKTIRPHGCGTTAGKPIWLAFVLLQPHWVLLHESEIVPRHDTSV